LPSEGSVYYQLAAGVFRLPTEVEWEYAARGGSFQTETDYAGSGIGEDVAWYDDNSGRETHPVGLMQPNALGLYDMNGNVWEWCWGLVGSWNWYDPYQKHSKPDPLGQKSSSARMLRGGSWYNDLRNVRVSYRDGFVPVYRSYYVGFRLARIV
jgi:formylglycine-generating enzyme required for sulfatase activity